MHTHELAISLTPLIVGATGLEAIKQNIRMIVTTLAYTVPLDRSFAHVGAFIDAPTPHAVARSIALLTHAIEEQEPRVTVLSITYPQKNITPAINGCIYPVIRFALKQGVVL